MSQRPLTSLWDELWPGRSPLSPAERVHLLCHRALKQPETLSEWPQELLEGDNYAGVLARLLAWTRLQEAMDDAPPGLESEVERLLPKVQRQADWLQERIEAFPPLEAWFWREKGRCVGLAGGDPLPHWQQSLRCAEQLEQWAEVARTRVLLAECRCDPVYAQDRRGRQELQPLLAALPALTAAGEADELRKLVLEAIFRLVPLEAILWLERGEEWEVKSWWPTSALPRFSQSLVEHCWRSQEFCWGESDQLRASRSILLSDVGCLMAAPAGNHAVLFGWQSTRQNWITAGQVEVVKFLAGLAGTLQENLLATEAARQDLSRSHEINRRWNTIFSAADELALAELSDDGALTRWNHAFERLFPEASAGISASYLLPQAQQQEDLRRLQCLRETSSTLVRLEVNGLPRWFQLTDWKVSGQPGIFRGLVDVSERELDRWFEYVEELRHRLAADLHDQPAQIAAAMQLISASTAGFELNQHFRWVLDLFRSPWLEARDAWSYLDDLVSRWLNGCRLEASVEALTPLQQQCLYRVVLVLLAEWKDKGSPQRIVCSTDANGAKISWSPPSRLNLPNTARELIDASTTVLRGNWQGSEGLIRLNFPQDFGC